jgi:hypothetical protein
MLLQSFDGILTAGGGISTTTAGMRRDNKLIKANKGYEYMSHGSIS